MRWNVKNAGKLSCSRGAGQHLVKRLRVHLPVARDEGLTAAPARSCQLGDIAGQQTAREHTTTLKTTIQKEADAWIPMADGDNLIDREEMPALA